MFALKSYLSFLLKSTNEHGVHSPFVFDFVTKCLYNKQLLADLLPIFSSTSLSKKQIQLLLKIIYYFKVKSIFTEEDTLKKIDSISKDSIIFTELTPTNYDLIFIHQPKKELDIFLDYMHNDSVLIIDNIHCQKNKALWQELLKSPKITAYIDIFWQGYVFIRKEQPKQGFYIRV